MKELIGAKGMVLRAQSVALILWLLLIVSLANIGCFQTCSDHKPSSKYGAMKVRLGTTKSHDSWSFVVELYRYRDSTVKSSIDDPSNTPIIRGFDHDDFVIDSLIPGEYWMIVDVGAYMAPTQREILRASEDTMPNRDVMGVQVSFKPFNVSGIRIGLDSISFVQLPSVLRPIYASGIEPFLSEPVTSLWRGSIKPR